jgi:hypothetical protein
VRHAEADDLDLTLEGRVLDPVVQAAALQRVVHVAGAVGREDHDRGCLRGEHDRAPDRHLVVRQHLEQVRLELVVGAVDLVDQQDRRRRVVVVDRAQQRPLEEEPLLVQLLLERPVSSERASPVASPARRWRSWRE